MANDPAMIPLMISACPFALTPELIIAIATAALSIATVVLAVVTAWMAYETRRTATAALKALQFEQMPILGFRDLAVQTVKQAGQPGTLASIRVGVELFNAGRVPVKYEAKSFSVWFANQGMTSGQFVSRGGRVLPGASTFFWHPTLPLNPPVSTFPANGHIRFEYEYSDESGGQLRPTTERVNYTIEPHFRISWGQNVDEASAS
jgi:hypothetical protein